ncbi:rhomboid family intramembrane serine protease [Halalkalibacter alkaliphilus]|uniref:Rhomboid family intramembrane serine protease n=1 Tax=Halalkalibacter alkaliphilus TaxID=2917993 RepID=A0A9X2CWJ8_9BACI|nr:rhomboid family intramembrane serine protease [Halalkalibacter alkaliphilus]MCL7749640.1 rhomboid family intramembrane serine protease [Halalkalibacter alkaliphilus]
MFIRNESFYSFRRQYPVITILVAIHLILFVWMNFLPFGNYIRALGIGYNLAIANGEYWRLLTPIFMHIGAGHVIFNSFSLVIFGPALERMLGKIKFILVYLITGIIANIATFYLGGLTYPPHLGASGAIFGLLGMYVYLVINRKDLIDRMNSQLVLTIIVIGLVMTFVNPNINILAHLFGLIAGAALAPLFLIGARPFYAGQRVFSDPSEPVFDPNRWQKKRVNSKRIKQAIWIGFGILVIFGILGRFL